MALTADPVFESTSSARRARFARAIVLALVAVLFAAPAGAQDASSQGGRIPVRVVDGRLVTSCDLISPARRIPANLFVEYDGLFGLQIHNRAAAALRIETGEGQTTPLTVRFPGFSITVPRRELGDEDALEAFTKYHSTELGENAVVGAIGAEVFRDWHVTFDLAAGYIELRPPNDPSAEPPALATVDGVVTAPITLVNDFAWLPVRYGDGSPGALAVGTTRYDTIIDTPVCERFGAPAGDIGPLRCGELDLATYVALRPEAVVQVHPDGVAGVLGTNLLEHVRLEIDRVNNRATITPVIPPRFPAEDVSFFGAMVDEDAPAIEAWLDEHADARLAREAADMLLDLRLSEEAEPEVVKKAIQRVNDVMPEDLRATRMHDLMVELGNEGFDEYVVAAGEVGIESGRDDRYPNTVHEIHGKLGATLLEAGDDREAWRHLLSAAFGLPEDGMINLDLGRYYERAGRPRRAFSRYLQAVIKPESGPQALEGLQRVDGELAADRRFSVELVDRMIAGKVRNFGAAGTFKPESDTTGRVALVEFFTNAHLGDGRGGAIGGALGNQGLLGHFEPDDAVFLSYHTPAPQLDPMVNELAMRTAADLRVPGPYVHRVNGVRQAPGAARWRQAEAVYNACRKVVLEELAKPTPYAIDLDAMIEDGVVRGQVAVRGPKLPGLRVQVIIAERGVLFPGTSEIVVHRFVARGAATPNADGVPYRPVLGRMAMGFERSLDDLEIENGAYLDDLVSRGGGAVARMSMTIDPHEVVLVVCVRNGETGEVLQAAQFEPPVIVDGEVVE